MALIEWQERFRIGIPSADYEHQELIALLNELYEGLTSGKAEFEIVEFLGEVHSRISAHFALEERLMQERGYDQYDTHKSEHEEILDDIREIMDAYEAGAFEDSIEYLGRRLESWFGDHFRDQDARLHKTIGGDNLDHGEI
ncbi:MAG: bacteriohemerythrin [Rhodospirillales bacterium]|nr:bacteriohemerythrin [Rhodospirillales bacterium]